MKRCLVPLAVVTLVSAGTFAQARNPVNVKDIVELELLTHT